MTEIPIKGLIFEGLDKSGKSTIYRMLNNSVDGKLSTRYFKIDRGPGSAIVFGTYFKRAVGLKEYYELDQWFAENNFILVYITAEDDILEQRTREANEEQHDIGQIKRLYERYLSETKMPVIRLDTSGATAEESIKELKIKLARIGYSYYEQRD